MMRKLHLTPPVTFDDVTFCVHTAGLAAAWLNTFKVFAWDFWIGIIFCLFICAFIIFGFIRYEPVYRTQNYAWSLLTTFGFCIAMFTVKFEPHKVFIRIFVTTLLLLGINCYAAFISSLINILTNPRRAHQVSTIHDIVDHNLEVYGSINHLNYIMQYKLDEPDFVTISKRFFVCKSNIVCFQRFRNNTNSAVISSRKHALNSRIAASTDKYCFDDHNNLFTYSVSVISYPFHHLLGLLNVGINQVVAGGFISKWERDVRPKNVNIKPGRQIQLTLTHLQGAFILIGIGGALAIAAFVVEWGYFYHSKGRAATFTKFKEIANRAIPWQP